MRSRLILLTLLLACSTGCATWSHLRIDRNMTSPLVPLPLRERQGEGSKKAEVMFRSILCRAANRPQEPIRQIASLWQTVPRSEKATTGIVGEVFFFTARDPRPAAANGSVRISLDRLQSAGDDRGQPVHQFDFTAAEWQAQQRALSLGTGYAVFLPLNDPPGPPARYRLQIALHAEGQPTVYSDVVAITLASPVDSEPPGQQVFAPPRPLPTLGPTQPWARPVAPPPLPPPAPPSVVTPAQIQPEVVEAVRAVVETSKP